MRVYNVKVKVYNVDDNFALRLSFLEEVQQERFWIACIGLQGTIFLFQGNNVMTYLYTSINAASLCNGLHVSP